MCYVVWRCELDKLALQQRVVEEEGEKRTRCLDFSAWQLAPLPFRIKVERRGERMMFEALLASLRRLLAGSHAQPEPEILPGQWGTT